MLSAAGLRPTGTPAPSATPTRAPPTGYGCTCHRDARNGSYTCRRRARLNVPLIDAVAGAPELDANNRAIVWGAIAKRRLHPTAPGGRGDGPASTCSDAAHPLGQWRLRAELTRSVGRRSQHNRLDGRHTNGAAAATAVGYRTAGVPWWTWAASPAEGRCGRWR